MLGGGAVDVDGPGGLGISFVGGPADNPGALTFDFTGLFDQRSRNETRSPAIPITRARVQRYKSVCRSRFSGRAAVRSGNYYGRTTARTPCVNAQRPGIDRIRRKTLAKSWRVTLPRRQL